MACSLMGTMRKHNISVNLIHTVEQLYDKATSAVLMNGSTGVWFRTTVRVRQGCLLSPTLFNIFLERIMSDAMEKHDGKGSVGGRNITSLPFANDIAS
ncbi:MAG: reverse transcriptase domain-containing protein [Candidatus Thiodiazotropha sp.]